MTGNECDCASVFPFSRVVPVACAVLVLLTGAASAQDFDWSWQEEPEQPETAQVDQDPGQEFDWEWSEEDAGKAAPETPARRESVREAADEPQAIDPAAYNDVMRENIELRKRVAEKERVAASAAERADRLEKQQQTLQAQMNTLASTIETLESQRAAASGDSERAKALEEKLAEAEREKTQLASRLSELEIAVADAPEEGAPPEAGSVRPGPVVQPGSDLFRQMQEENVLLKQRLAEVEAAGSGAPAAAEETPAEPAAENVRARERQLREQLKAAKETQGQQKDLISNLVRRIPEMETELARLRERAGGDETVLAAREREIENVREELRRREYRLIKAERMASMLSEARRETQAVTAEQTRNMHYNMAVVYAKEGRFREAETEYLRALRIDPSDAATHYNIAILYDDELKNKDRAAVHYRKYLQLAPEAPDRDQVRQWIMRLEME